MDFKVAGNEVWPAPAPRAPPPPHQPRRHRAATQPSRPNRSQVGISAFQLDIKCEGLSIELMRRALRQARGGGGGGVGARGGGGGGGGGGLELTARRG